MKRLWTNLVDGAGIFGAALFAAVGLLAIYAVLAYGGLALGADILPRWKAVERRTVEQSKSFTDSRNDAALNLIREHARLSESEAGQRQAIYEQICQTVDTMAAGTVAPAVSRWVATNGGCE